MEYNRNYRCQLQIVWALSTELPIPTSEISEKVLWSGQKFPKRRFPHRVQGRHGAKGGPPLSERPSSLLAVLWLVFVCAACAWQESQDVPTSPSPYFLLFVFVFYLWVFVLEGFGWGGALRFWAPRHLTLLCFGFILGAFICFLCLPAKHCFCINWESFGLFCPVKRSPAHSTAYHGQQDCHSPQVILGQWVVDYSYSGGSTPRDPLIAVTHCSCSC